MSNVTCIECDADVVLPETPEVGEILTCQECSVELEITGTNPAVVEKAPEVEEDWGE